MHLPQPQDTGCSAFGDRLPVCTVQRRDIQVVERGDAVFLVPRLIKRHCIDQIQAQCVGTIGNLIRMIPTLASALTDLSREKFLIVRLSQSSSVSDGVS
ncbi:MAG: hypothetical protein JKX94_09425 [Sneathiella sp.]|nr:hypothetical protein [Sneathiella sp.]